MENNTNNNNTTKTPSSSSSSSSSSKLRSKILKILPKAAAAVTMTFQNPPFSPGRDHHHHHKPRSDYNNNASSLKSHANKGFSGPIMIPDEARRKHKDGSGIETQEPTSPKVSCIGQIKHKKKKQSKKQSAKSMSLPVVVTSTPKEEDATKTEEKNMMMKKQGSKKFQRMLIFNTGKPKTWVRKSSASNSTVIGGEGKINDDGDSDNNAPPIGYMRRFASGRETFANFDWKAQIAPEEMNHREFYSEDDRAESVAGEQEEEEEEEEEEEIMIPFSAPIGGRGGGGNGNGGFGGGFGGGGVGNLANLQPRKEINLWKRRTMAQPRPLQLNPVLTASK